MDEKRRLGLRQLIQANLRAIPWMDSAKDGFDRRQWLLSYRKYLIDTYQKADFAGIADANQRTPMALTSIFVEERFSAKEISPSDPDFSTVIAEPGEELEDLLLTWNAEHEPTGVAGRLVIIGPPGSGKSALVRVLAAGCSQMAYNPWNEAFGRRLVLPLILRDLNLQGVRTTEELLQRWADRVQRDRPGLPDLLNVKFYLETGWAIVAFDGVDEIGIAGRRHLRRLIAIFAARYPQAVILVTGRPAGFTDWSFSTPKPRLWQAMLRREGLPEGTPCPDFTKRFLRPFSDEQVESYLKRWFAARFPQEPARQQQKIERLLLTLRTNRSFAQIQRRPIYLATLTYVHDVKGELPNSFVEAYRAMVEACLDILEAAKDLDDHKKGLVAHVFDRLERRRVLERLAHDLHTKQLGSTPAGEESPFSLQFTEAEFTVWMAKWLGEKRSGLSFTTDKIPALLDFYRLRAGLLVFPEQGLLRFSHLSFQEFLTASWILRNRNRKDSDLLKNLLDRLYQEAWHPVGLSLFGLLHRSEEAEVQEELLQEWVEDPNVQVARGRLRFLHRLLSEGEQGLSEAFLLELWQHYWQLAISSFDSDWFELYLRIAERWEVWQSGVRQWMAQRLAQLPNDNVEATCNEITLLGAMPLPWLRKRWEEAEAATLERWRVLISHDPGTRTSLDFHGFSSQPRTLLIESLPLIGRLFLIDFFPSPFSILAHFEHSNIEQTLVFEQRAMESLLYFGDRALDLNQAREGDWVKDWAGNLDNGRLRARLKVLDRNLAQDLACDRSLARDLVQNKFLTFNWHRAWVQVLNQSLHQNLGRVPAHDRNFEHYFAQWNIALVMSRSSKTFHATPNQAITAFDKLIATWPDKKEITELIQKDWFPYKHIQKLAKEPNFLPQPLEALSHKLYRVLRYALEKAGKEVSDLPEELGPDSLRPGTLYRAWHGEEAAQNYLNALREAGYDPDKEPWPPLDQDEWLEQYKKETSG
ncbi:MAG: hypothetical protein HQL56_18220 [Magnetococcales bacterium]|nr:hypothetical protein [Magnetococcales bacterium]